VAPQLIAYTNQHATSALYIVGHSLGSSTAAILTIMLLDYIDEFRKSADQNDNQDFQIKCFGFAPACGLSLDLSERYKDHIQSYVFGDDVVSKMSYGSMMDVKELVIASSEAAHGLSYSKVFLRSQLEGPKWKTIFDAVADCRTKCLESLANPRVCQILGQYDLPHSTPHACVY
jgi:Lipase (class 3)